MASPIASTWVNATVLIETDYGQGTGFFVGRQIAENQWRRFIITNKHVLNHDHNIRFKMEKIKLHINIDSGSQVHGEIVEYHLIRRHTFGNVSHCWREHRDPNVDVLAIDADLLFQLFPNICNVYVPEYLFATKDKRKELDITAGEEIIVVGYPSGLCQGRTNYPLIRQGIIATRIGEELQEQNPFPRTIRGFMIDGATIPGSSGSPVVLKPVIGRYQNGNIVIETPPVLLGIIAETRFASVKQFNVEIPGFADIGVAFDVETIVETLNLFDGYI